MIPVIHLPHFAGNGCSCHNDFVRGEARYQSIVH